MDNVETNPEALVDFRGVALIHDGHTLVGPLDWEVLPGERWVVLGPNGAGKTSLVRLASAGAFPSQGTVHLLGEQVGRTDLRDLRAAIGISSAAVANRIPDSETVGDLVISAGYAVLGRWREEYDEADREQATEILEQVGAYHLVDRTWGTLSEGERKRVLVARAMMIDPELLILDEPGAGMDLGGREDLVGYLTDIAADPERPTVIAITHHVEEIPEGFTHALLLDEGQVVTQGPIEEVLTSENLSQTFHQPIELKRVDGRYFAHRVRRGGAHRG